MVTKKMSSKDFETFKVWVGEFRSKLHEAMLDHVASTYGIPREAIEAEVDRSNREYDGSGESHNLTEEALYEAVKKLLGMPRC